MMKMALVFSIVGLWTTVVHGQQEPTGRGVRMSAGEDSYHAKLKLTTSIVGKPLCVDHRMRYLLLFKFTNVGDQTVILNRFRPVASRYMVSASEKAAQARKYEANAHLLIALDDDMMNSGSALDESRFISLKSGASYEVKESFSISIQDDKGRSLRPGVHVLQVIVATWYLRESNIEWREKLRDKGYLWSDSVVSDPMPILIPTGTSGSNCQ